MSRSVTPSSAGAVSTRLRLCAAIVLGLLCAMGAIVMLDPGVFPAEAALAVLPCSTVTSNTNDSGPGSLRAALGCVPSGGTVTFTPALAGQTIVLTTTELAIAQSNITIDGSSAPGVKVDGNSAHRVFNVSAPLSIIALTIQHGSAYDGGGLLTSGALTLTNVTFLTNTASDNGGAANVGGAALLRGGLFQGNSAANWGGGLYANTAIVLTGTQFMSNTANSLGGGAFAGDVAALTGVLFQGNSGNEGGGLYASGSLALTGTQFIGNTASGKGGGARAAAAVMLNGGLFQDNVSTNRDGGGLFVSGAATLNGALFQSNYSPAGYGGGLYAATTLALTGTQFLSNTAAAGGGGAYAVGAATLNGSQFQNNRCTAGGCLSGGWWFLSPLSLTQFITTGDNIQNDGLTTQSAGGVILFDGSLTQTVAGAGSTTFNAMWLANTGAGVWLGQDLTVTNRLTLSSDLTTTRSYTLSLGPGATSAGVADVWGRTDRKHAFSNDVIYSFGNPNVSVDFTSGGAPAELTVDLTHTIPVAANFGNAVQRFYDIWQVGAGSFTATLRLHYTDNELNGNTEGALRLWHFPGANPWVAYTPSAFDTTNNWLESNAVTGFSPWLVSQNGPASPSAVRLESFDARAAAPQSAGTGWAPAAGAVLLLGLGLAASALRRKRR